MWWVAVAAIWTVLGLLSTTQTALVLAYRGEPVPWGPLVATRLADWYTCALFVPPFVWLARRYPLDRVVWRRHLPIHFAASIVAVFIKYALYVPIRRAILPENTPPFTAVLVANVFTELMVVWATIGVIHAVEFYRRYHDRESVAFQLSAELSRAQLDALRAQLQPHFLFNTLNAIATLIHRDPDAADSMLTRLADLLRASLQTQASHEWPLREELAVARAYVDIMRRRFGDRLAVTWRIEPGVEAALVPTFVVQPLLENAFEHAVDETSETLAIDVVAERREHRLCIAIADNGPGLRGGAESDDGIGLTNTRRRLAHLYGAAGVLAIRERAGGQGGMLVTVELPLRTSELSVSHAALAHV